MNWIKVAEADALKIGEVRAVQAEQLTVALVRGKGGVTALDNACPHQGGPLGEGSIECDGDDCWLRCPWHGWDFDPVTGEAPAGHDDAVATYPVEERDDGIYVQVPAAAAAPRTVSDVMVETLGDWGVRQVFGMVGHSNLGLAEALRLRAETGALSYYGVRHEGAASFACSGYAKLTGRPAACLSIAGPGATNLLTGLWDAHVDRAPVLALTGQINTQVFGPGAFQEIDLSSAFEAVAGFSQTVLPGSRHGELMALALKHALDHRDVAHLIFPDEVQVLAAAGEVSRPEGRRAEGAIRPDGDVLASMVDRVAAAKRPALIVGHGALGAETEILALAERLGAPVLTTFKAKGLVPDAHPLAAGVLGRSGTPIASWCMNEADLLIVLGASFSNHTGITPKKPIIQVDADAAALGRFHPVELPVQGEIAATLRELAAELPGRLSAADQRADLAERWSQWRAEKARRAARDEGRGLASAAVFAALSECCPSDAILSVDVGNNTYSFGRYFESRGQRVLMSGYLGSIGFALPAALGAWAATQEEGEFAGRPVVSISGDGGFGQYLAEFTTAVKYGMNITHVLLNNGELGKISKEQRAADYDVWQTDLRNPDFTAYAESCGGFARRVKTRDALDAALAAAIAHPGAALVEIVADPELI